MFGWQISFWLNYLQMTLLKVARIENWNSRSAEAGNKNKRKHKSDHLYILSSSSGLLHKIERKWPERETESLRLRSQLSNDLLKPDTQLLSCSWTLQSTALIRFTLWSVGGRTNLSKVRFTEEQFRAVNILRLPKNKNSQNKFFEERTTSIMNWFLCRQLQARGAAPRPAAGCGSSVTSDDAKRMSVSEQWFRDGASMQQINGDIYAKNKTKQTTKQHSNWASRTEVLVKPNENTLPAC